LTYRKIDRIAFRKLFFLPQAKKRKQEKRHSIKAQTGKKLEAKKLRSD
jgi:hypothetical protein